MAWGDRYRHLPCRHPVDSVAAGMGHAFRPEPFLSTYNTEPTAIVMPPESPDPPNYTESRQAGDRAPRSSGTPASDEKSRGT